MVSWVAGSVVAGVADEQVAELRRSPLSGDWRRVDGNLELVAALAVNSPGFPILEEDTHGAYSLVAAGALADQDGVGEPDAAPAHGDSPFAGVDLFLTDMAGAERGRVHRPGFPMIFYLHRKVWVQCLMLS